MPRAAPRDSRVPISEPDCDSAISRPGSRVSASSAALVVIVTRSATLITPMEFGPSSRSPPAAARATSRSWRWRPSGPVSAKPSASTVAAGTPSPAASITASSTRSAALTM